MRKIAAIAMTLAALGMLACGLVGLVHPLSPFWKLSEVSFIRVTFAGGYVQLAASLPIDGTAGPQGGGLVEWDFDLELRPLGGRIMTSFFVARRSRATGHASLLAPRIYSLFAPSN